MHRSVIALGVDRPRFADPWLKRRSREHWPADRVVGDPQAGARPVGLARHQHVPPEPQAGHQAFEAAIWANGDFELILCPFSVTCTREARTPWGSTT